MSDSTMTVRPWNVAHGSGPLRWARFIDGDGAPSDGGDGSGPDDGADKGFPVNTPLSEMSVEQREAYWKDKSRKHETAERTLRTQLDAQKDYADLKKQLDDQAAAAMSEQEKAQQEALDQARMQGENIGSAKWRDVAVRQSLRAAAAQAGVPAAKEGEEDPLAAVLDSLDTSKLLTEQGEIDEGRIGKIVASFAPAGGGDSRQGGDPFFEVARRAANGGSGESVEELEKKYADKYKTKES